MSTPSKRRKKNDGQPARGLDYFFGKQAQAKQQPKDEPNHEAQEASTKFDNLDHDVLSDEALARKLQAEWDEQDRAPQAPTPSPSKSAVTTEADEAAAALPNHIKEERDVKEETPTPAPALAPVAVNPFAGLGKKNTLSLQSATADDDTVTYDIPFDQSPLTFDPQKYIPELKKQWVTDNGHATYALLTHCFVMVNSTQSRIKIVDTLVNALRVIIEGDPQSLLPAVWLATNSISPPYIDMELGLGGSAISKALKKVCGLDNAGLKKLSDKYGDAGDVAFEAKKRQSLTLRKPKPLTIKAVFDSLVKISLAKGHGSVETKQRLVERLVQDARGAEESRYVVRTLVQHLRIGAVKTTMLIALSRAFLLSKPPGADFSTRDRHELAKLSKQQLVEVWAPAEEVVKACFARRPNYSLLLTKGLGQRAQVHCDSAGKVTIFSRHLEVMTDKYPDLVALVPKIRGEGVDSFILEGEVVAVDRETGALLPFQTLSNRARKDVAITSVTVDVCLFSFDLMYLNGEGLMDRSFRERRSLLRSLFIELPHHFTWVKSIDATSADVEAISDFYKQALSDKCEGFMAKVLDNLPNPDLLDANEDGTPKPPPTPSKRKRNAKRKPGDPPSSPPPEPESATVTKKGGRRKALLATYEPDKRLDSWLKVKKDYDSSASDTIDLIPIAAWHGTGRKCNWWSPILLACRNPETGGLEAVTKCMAGFSDTFYKANRAKYDPDAAMDEDEEEDAEEEQSKTKNNTLGSKPSYVEYSGGHPDVWFSPQEVWECAFADVTLSPTYTAAIGLVSEERGLSLRFPRFLKVREDKSIDEASTSDFLAELYRKQEARGEKEKEKKDAEIEEEDIHLLSHCEKQSFWMNISLIHSPLKVSCLSLLRRADYSSIRYSTNFQADTTPSTISHIDDDIRNESRLEHGPFLDTWFFRR
ncbi:ATP-dependent DNA ligase [Aureobasidium sp. EXF-10727]|nr:ATP-dependent DNA ligase [Aureobasidium sp. EXF-10727]